MAELSAKKVKKEKLQNGEVVESMPSKLKKDRSEVSKENTVLNGSAQKKKKTTLDESTTEKVEKGTGSKIRSTKLRMMDDCWYIEELMAMVRIPSHNLDLDQEEDEEDYVEDVPVELKIKMRKDNEEGRAVSHEELKERLHRKMQELGERGKNLSTNEEKRQKRLKQKLKKIEKKKNEKNDLKQKLMKVGKNAGNLNKIKNELEGAGVVVAERPKVKTETGKIIFSKFDFASDEVTGEAIKKKNMDPKAALAKIAKNKEVIKSMEEKGLTEKVKRIENKVAWQTALDKAEGVKVKDDVELLKKALKKREQVKKSSKRKWEQRTEDVQSKKDKFQTKRKDNLQKRKATVKDNKKKKAIKKGRLIPGL